MPEPLSLPKEPWDDLQSVLDQELDRLPAKYRAAIVLYDLEGKTHKEAARQLGWPVGTLSTRLVRGRAMLAKWLARHGLAVSGGALAVALSQGAAPASVPASVVSSTIKSAGVYAAGKAATSLISAKTVALAEGVVKSMLLAKLKIMTTVLALSAIAYYGAGVLRHTVLAAQQIEAPMERKGEKSQPKPAGQESSPKPIANSGKEKRETPARDAQKEVPQQAPAPAPGYRWVMEPKDGRGYVWAIGRVDGKGVAAFEDKDKEGALLLTLAHPPATNQAYLLEFRPVAFDDQAKRYLLKHMGGVATGEVGLDRFRLDPKELPADKVKRLGVELLTPEGLQHIAEEAIARAKKEGIEVLPRGRVGKEFDFVLTTLEGRKLRSQDLRGKVVLLDCWSCT